jgi:hypothetical protein
MHHSAANWRRESENFERYQISPEFKLLLVSARPQPKR